jgi:RNase P/RNase MRP subunit p29
MKDLIGQKVSVVKSNDKGQAGVTGSVVLESMNMLLIDNGRRKLSIPKAGTVLRLESTRELLRGDELVGRIEDRIGKGSSR